MRRGFALSLLVVAGCGRDSHAPSPAVIETAPVAAPPERLAAPSANVAGSSASTALKPGERIDVMAPSEVERPGGARADDSIASIRRANDGETSPAAPRAIEHRVTCGDVTAIWSGENDGDYDHWSVLAFAIRGRARTSAHELALPDDMSFDIFSPDCKRVLLLQSRHGPFHVVRTHELAAYLAGGAPEQELRGTPSTDGISGTGVFRGGGWISNTEVAFTWGCCDPPVTTRVGLPAL